MMVALAFATKIKTPLIAHLTIHWGGTNIGDDPDGKVFARYRQLLDKRLQRRGIRGGLTAVWVRECQPNRRTGMLSEIVHGHLLFHLPAKYRRRPHHNEILTVIEELVERVGNGNFDDRTFALTFPPNPDGLYLLKGGTAAVLDKHSVPGIFRSHLGEGLIQAKRCGTTQNIGLTARLRWESEKQEQDT